MKKTIFIVDDNYTNLAVAEKVLESQYSVIGLPSAAEMFATLEKTKPDLILLDIIMPEMGGFEAIDRLKSNETLAQIPVIFLTGHTDEKAEATGIKLGAVDFISKPFSEPVLLNRIQNHLHINEIIKKRTEQLIRLQNSIVFTLAEVVENRDKNTGGHIGRTAVYMKILIEAMMRVGAYSNEMKNWDIDAMISSARLHDLGKIAIPDSILNKPDKLNSEEFTIIKTHSKAGERIIDHMAELSGNGEFLYNAKIIAAYHHEKWDGTGYPYGLSEMNIPLQGRIMTVVDVYDALTSARSYKKAFSNDEAFLIIKQGSGIQFDAVITDIFIRIQSDIEEAKARLP